MVFKYEKNIIFESNDFDYAIKKIPFNKRNENRTNKEKNKKANKRLTNHNNQRHENKKHLGLDAHDQLNIGHSYENSSAVQNRFQ